MRELDETCISVGHIFFHPGTRRPPIPPLAQLQAFIANHPELPIVVDTDRPDPCEAAHIVLAQFLCNHDNDIGVDSSGNPIIYLYTIAADHRSRAFDPATHFKDGEQMEGVDIFNWNVVNFDATYRTATSLSELYRRVYRDLRATLML
jgi:hypothetical protein